MSAPLQTIAAHPVLERKADSRPGQATGFPRLTARSAPLNDPLAFLQSRQGLRFYAWLPEEDVEVCGIASAWETTAEGPTRFDRVKSDSERLFAAWRKHGETMQPWHRLWGGFAFSDTVDNDVWRGFPAARWFVPAFQYFRKGSEAWYVHAGPNALRIEGPLTATAETPRADLIAEPDRMSDWEGKVAAALNDIASADGPEKIVLARRRVFALRRGPGLRPLLARLRARQTTGILMAVEGAPDRWFVTATPERLVTLRDGRVETHAVAGTTGASSDPVDNERLRSRLLASEKDRREHEWVVQSLAQSLQHLCTDFHRRSEPTVLSLPTVQHLMTPINARPLPEVGLFDIGAALHPTAAVGGFPQRQAEAWLRRNEEFDRGWYAAPLGYATPDGDGSLFVAIRSGLLTPDSVTLFAGAGLVTGSDAGAEWKETEDKIRTLLDVLEAS